MSQMLHHRAQEMRTTLAGQATTYRLTPCVITDEHDSPPVTLSAHSGRMTLQDNFTPEQADEMSRLFAEIARVAREVNDLEESQAEKDAPAAEAQPIPDDVMAKMVDRFMWAVTTGPSHPDASAEKAVETILQPLLDHQSGVTA